MIEDTTIAASLLVGALIGRWWSIALAVPAGLIGQSMYSWEGASDTEVGVLFGIASAIGLVVGTVLGKILRRLAPPNDGVMASWRSRSGSRSAS